MDWNKLLNASRRRATDRSSVEVRTEFERDLGRIAFSAPVRRLQDKAQVFPLEPNDSVRTRLTHSYEVSNVARGIAEALLRVDILKHLSVEQQRAIPQIAAAVGIIHDLGNPPFGHAGESAIQEWFKRSDEVRQPLNEGSDVAWCKQVTSDFDGFDGNAQTVRLVSRLQVLGNDNVGLNLTFGTLSTACKYVVASHQTEKNNKQKKKPGYFFSEQDVVKEVQSATGTGEARHPLTYVVEAADDIVYSSVDVEDAITKRVFSWDEFAKLFTDGTATGVPAQIVESVEKYSKPFSPSNTYQTDVLKSQVFRTQSIIECVNAVVRAFEDNYDRIMSGDFTEDLISVSRCAEVNKKLGEIGRTRIYVYPTNTSLELRGRHVIKDLCNLYWEVARAYDGDGTKFKGLHRNIWAMLSENYKQVFELEFKKAQGDESRQHYARVQLVCDNVSGMTDTYACELHRNLFNG